ncbi:unnamed protein product [Brachionus calyciflorus]|uniref:DOMON domain-containing protein n=1 Tax=Brachionus calyciflorus TaxID=104777 RepID=A0A814E8W1_9BILA|nr:unnamed protein product [Brachionus calyciflorus]
MKFFLLISLLISSCLCNSINIDDVYVTWKNTGEKTYFKVTANLKEFNYHDCWISIGINRSPLMNGANSVVCRMNNNVTWTRHYLNNGRSPSLLDENEPSLGLSDTCVSVIKDNITCQFIRKNQVDDKMESYFKINETNEYYLIYAAGEGDFGMHSRQGQTRMPVRFHLNPLISPADTTKSYDNNESHESNFKKIMGLVCKEFLNFLNNVFKKLF